MKIRQKIGLFAENKRDSAVFPGLDERRARSAFFTVSGNRKGLARRNA
jgi:hypothetical protein